MRGAAPNFPIAITGMHRSGTSMITRALHDSGLHLVGSGAEELIDAAEDNPEGFWENKAIVACNDELLEAVGGSWDNPPDLVPQAADDPRVAHLVPTGLTALGALSGHDRWGFKDPRTCLTAAYWLDLQPDLRFIVCVRHPLEVALSLKRRNQNSYSLGLTLWERYYATVLALVPADRRIVTHYDAYFVDADAELARLGTFAGLTPAPARVRSDLRHHSIGVGLADAGVGERLRALYATLCREAGVPQERDGPPDEGRVRRLLLDGAVAARHAEQRQAAVERLQEREEQFRAEHRAQIRDLERRLADARGASARKLEALEVETLEKLRAIAAATTRTQSTIETMERRRFARRAKRAVRRTLRGADRLAEPLTQRLPSRAQQRLQQLRRVARRGARAPAPTLKEVGRRVAPKAAGTTRAAARSVARSTARRLPSSTTARLRITVVRLRRARAEPRPSARRVVRRLPPPAQDAARRAWRRSAELRRRMAARRAAAEASKAAPTPKGPAAGQWKQGFGRLVATLPDGTDWLVVTPGSPAGVREARKPRATLFPDNRKGRPLVDDLAHIAQLEALRYAGHRYLVLPEGSRPWFHQQAELRDHVVSSYLTVEDRASAGAVFDLTRPASADDRSLRGEVARLAGAGTTSPAVLAWTDLDVAAELPGVTTFRPPPGSELPYLDRSVDIVVVDAAHDPNEAARVATHGVITVRGEAGGITVRGLERTTNGDQPEGEARPRAVLWTTEAGTDPRWQSMLEAHVADAEADLVVGAVGADTLGRLADLDVVILVEPHVLPLPGALEAAAALVAARPGAAVTGKVLRGDGRLESAGGTVFADRSVALIASGSEDVRAPWHDYARPVCWGSGIVAASGSRWAAAPVAAGGNIRAFLREWSAALWEQGAAVRYEPAISGVRLTGDGGEPALPLDSSRWQRVLDLRPTRPPELGDGEWRYLLAHDDVEACRR